MRILHLLGERGFSGGEVQLEHVLGELVRRGHENRLILQPGARFGGTAARLGLAGQSLRMRGGFAPLAAWRARRAVRASAPDLVHLADARAHKLGALARLRRLGAPVVVTRRMDYPLRWGPYSRWLYAHAVDATIAVSNAVKHEIVRVGVADERVHVIHDGIDPTPFADLAPRRADARAGLGLPAAATVVLNAATLRPRKGQVHLLHAFARFAARRPDVHLLLAGEGDDAQRLRATAASLDLATRVCMPGRIDVRDALAASDVACIPSLREGLSVFSLEAQAAGLPVVASDVGGLRESVEDGVTGRLVPPGDEVALAAALDELLGEPAQRTRLGRAGPGRIARHFTADRMAGATADRYEMLVSGRGRQRALGPIGGR